MIIEAEIGGHCIHRMYVDGGSASEILYEHCFNRLCSEIKNQLVPATTPLIGFSGEIIWPIGQIQLLTMSQKIASSSVNISQNAETPVRRRSNYPKKQQVGPAGMCVGLRTRRDPSGCQTNSGRKSQGGNKSEISRTNIYLWGRRRDVLRIQSEHQGAEFMSRQGRCCLKSSIPKILERRTKVKRKARKPEQTTEAEEAFKQMKQLIAELLMLTAPMEKEKLIIYLAAAKEMVSAVLMTKREAKQMPIYFVSRALRGLKINYTSTEKLVLALVHARKRLKRYFQAHPIIVIMDQPIQKVLSRPEVAGRLQKWSIELGEYTIHYRPRVSVKGQILADFIVERPEEESSDTLMEAEEELPKPWILFTDGSSCTDGSGAGLILTNPEGMEFTYALRFRFDATNNEAEYEALIAGLRIAEQMGVKNLQANVDSRLVAKQVNGTQVPRSENKKADALSKISSTSFAYLSNQVLVEELKEKSTGEMEVLAVVKEEGDTWMTLIFEYLTEEILLADVKKARAVRRNLGEGIKARLGAKNKNRLGELSHVLWAHRTMIKSINGETLFSLTYGTEAVIPAEIGMPTLRTVEVDLVQNNETLEINLGLLEETRTSSNS
ncbi:reverse transcriptase domain-containing protein [Tanacetum coccineum]